MRLTFPRSILLLRTVALAALATAALPGQTDGTRRWAFTTLSTTAPGSIVASPTVGPDGTIYIGTQIGTSTSASPGGQLFALDPSGNRKWVYTAPDWIDSTPAVANDGTIYFGCWDGKLYALRADGSLRWAFTAASFIASSPALGTDGTIYIGAASNLVAVTPDGALKWTFPTEDWVDSAPAIGPDGAIYAGSWDGNIYAVNPNGSARWSYATDGAIVGSPALASDGTLYLGSRDAYLYALTPGGTLKWRFDTQDAIEASPVLGADGSIYVATTGGRIIALAPDGAERWRYPRAGQTALNPIVSTPAVRADGSLVFGTSNNALYSLRPDGTLLWSSAIDDPTDSSPLITPDGTIYIGAADKKLYSFTGTSAAALTDWSQFRRDPRRTGWQPLGAVSGTAGRLVNLAVRSVAGSDANTLIVGFVVSGAGERNLLVRGVGPTLTNFSVSGFLADPRINLFNGSAALASNDNWGDNSNAGAIANMAATVGAFALPSGSLDAALLRNFSGGGTSVHVSGAGGAVGIALKEVYDAGGSSTSRLANVSARSTVGTGAGILIAGFVVGENARAVLIRGVGPSLTQFGVPGVLNDPELRIFRGSQLLGENNDWAAGSNRAQVSGAAQSVAAFSLPTDSRDAALLLTLPPGAYTAQVSGVNNTTGIALVEVYEIQ